MSVVEEDLNEVRNGRVIYSAIRCADRPSGVRMSCLRQWPGGREQYWRKQTSGEMHPCRVYQFLAPNTIEG